MTTSRTDQIDSRLYLKERVGLVTAGHDGPELVKGDCVASGRVGPHGSVRSMRRGYLRAVDEARPSLGAQLDVQRSCIQNVQGMKSIRNGSSWAVTPFTEHLYYAKHDAFLTRSMACMYN